MEETGQAPIDIHQYIAIMLDQTASIAWQKLGLQPDMVTGKTEPDFGQAKIAIDLCAHLSQLISDSLEGEDLRQVNNLINDLRVNYMQRIQ
ncbi:MAG: DUF1844 domain-containing protein [Fimbriimonadaceae bacterium]|nr:DUF1844 domain-containing protein [Fimbriimonadaceae bacterium]